MKDKLLVHACCGPCLVAVYEDIEEKLRGVGADIERVKESDEE